MIPAESRCSEAAGAARAKQIRANMHQIERRQRWLWSSAVMVTLLLTLGVASFAFPGLLAQAQAFYAFYLDQAVRGLVVLSFAVQHPHGLPVVADSSDPTPADRAG